MSLVKEFDHYNPPLGPDGTPFEYYEALRDEAIATDTPIGWSEKYGGFWVCVGYEETRQIFHDTESFSNLGTTFPGYATPGGRDVMLAGMDEPAHKKYRRLVQAPFSPTQAAAIGKMVRDDLGHQIDAFINEGRADICEVLTREVPGRVTAMLLGLPADDGSRYRRWVHAVASQSITDPEGAAPHLKEMDEHFANILEERRANPGDDVLSLIMESEVDGERLTDEEIYDFFIILLIGGIDNTVFLLSDMMWRLAWDKELRRRLARHPEMHETAADEFIRYFAPGNSGRIVTKRIELGGVTMEPGQHLFPVLAVVNRDPVAFASPDTFDPQRSPNRHLSLGLGIHRCLGAHLLRAETAVVLGEFLKRVPEFELDPDRKSVYQPGQVGGFVNVPIVFPPGGRAEDGAKSNDRETAAAAS